MMEPLVSIIIPVYNASKTLSLTLESLRGQTYKQLELIFVNDASTDDSLFLLNEFKENLLTSSVKIVNHVENQGVACARNTGLANSTGKYIYFIDADDYMSENTIHIMLDAAEKEDLDIVGCNWYLSFKQNSRKMSQPNFKNGMEAVELMLTGQMRWNLWLFLIRRELFVKYNIGFLPKMNMGEDAMMMTKLFYYSNRVKLINEFLYHYNQNVDSSLTKTYSEQNFFEVSSNVEEIEKFVLRNDFPQHIKNSINFFKLNIKLPLLVSYNRTNYERWNTWYVESNSHIFKNPYSTWRTKFLEWACVNKMYVLIDIYYLVVIKMVYGVIYR
ncbi:glycosyltransferase family 2 protein [Sphingobacterium bovistauri]|uniref:Glycosyltransferase n=1 Tax=Sphingobacterium bovistauri TaxID=2781959 RepID=A0ABS7Z3I2_9SPHI|nr:glycosyltransferase [Sphingobacterium bovistauri]MCA5004122.1 glycosyltransferase [Sphingobacterium bovistauri]